MSFSLIEKNVEKACNKYIDNYEDDCAGFVRAVAQDLHLFLPGENLMASN
jgi:hypothetical protein